MKKIILIGAGGHAKSCIDVIESTKQYKIQCLLEKKIGNEWEEATQVVMVVILERE